MNWETIKLGTCVSIKGGGTPSRKKKHYWNGPIPWCSVKDFTSDKLDKTQESISEEGLLNSSSNLIQKGTIILPTRMALGKVAINSIPMAINQDLKALFILNPDQIDTEYLSKFLRSKANYIERNGSGATVKGITLPFLKDIKVPLPSLETQNRIVFILNQAQALIDKRKKQIKLMDQVIQSLFYEMFGDPVINRKKWTTSEFGKYIESIIGGKSVNGKARDIKMNEYAVLKISAVTSGIFNSKEYKVVESKDVPENRIHPKKGDLLFSRANTKEMVGATCIVDKDYDNLFLPDKIWKVTLKSKHLTNWFVKVLLSHQGFRENLKRVATGTSGSMLNISMQKLKELEIIAPPITLQNQFAERVKAIEAQKETMKASLKELEDNFNSMMQRAFKGELVA